MSVIDYITQVPSIAARVGVIVPEGWHGLDAVLPLIDQIRADGSIFILKFDGERTDTDDTGQFTVLVSGTALGDDPIRVDAESLEVALAFSFVKYAERVWA